MTDFNNERVLDGLAEQFHNPTPNTNQIPTAFMRFAKVISVGSSTATIQFAGSSSIPNVRWIAGVTAFVAGNTVAVIQYKFKNEETAYLILGKLS